MPTSAARQDERTAGPRLVAALYGRFRNLLHELAKFGAVGAVAWVVDTGLFNVFYGLGTLTAKVLATSVAVTVAFLGNRYWTFRHRERSRLPKQYLFFFMLNGVGLLIQLAVLGVSHYWLGSYWPEVFATRLADTVSANVVGLVLSIAFRFYAYRRWVFLQPNR